MDEPFTGATGGAVTSTLDQFIDMHMKFCVDLQDTREHQLLGAASVREMTDGLKKKLDGEFENLFRPLLEQAMRADMQLEQAMCARLASVKCQRSRSRSRSRSRAGNGNCKDNGKGKDKGNDTGMGASAKAGERAWTSAASSMRLRRPEVTVTRTPAMANGNGWSVMQPYSKVNTLLETPWLWFEHV